MGNPLSRNNVLRLHSWRPALPRDAAEYREAARSLSADSVPFPYRVARLSRGTSGSRAVTGEFGAGNETRTRDPDLGKVVLYQLSYSRSERPAFYRSRRPPQMTESHFGATSRV